MYTPPEYPNLYLPDHPLVKRDVSLLRDKETPSAEFRTALSRLTRMIAYESTAQLALRGTAVETPLERSEGYALAEEIVIVPILRAGLGMVDGFLDILPDARVGHVGLYRNEETLEPVDYYAKFPGTLNESVIFILDPMLATGGSASAAISFVKEKGGRRISLANIVAAPEGVRAVWSRHPDVNVYAAVLDRELNENGYILPGLGDAGDRYFSTGRDA
jgi:uracil phosphoribosyltransferase